MVSTCKIKIEKLAVTFAQLSLWQAGIPSRITFAKGRAIFVIIILFFVRVSTRKRNKVKFAFLSLFAERFLNFVWRLFSSSWGYPTMVYSLQHNKCIIKRCSSKIKFNLECPLGSLKSMSQYINRYFFSMLKLGLKGLIWPSLSFIYLLLILLVNTIEKCT